MLRFTPPHATAALKIGGIKLRSRDLKRAGVAFATGGLSELGGARTLADLTAPKAVEAPPGPDPAEEAMRLENEARLKADEERRERLRRQRGPKGLGSNIFTSPLGLVGPAAGLLAALGGGRP